MQGLTVETRRVIADLARQYGISEDAVLSMLMAVKRGHGSMAQFNIGELGGNGQWMQGGMTMVGDMFNYGLKNTVDGLCNTLSQALSTGRIDLPGESAAGRSWWPQWLGSPSSAGAQNDSAYAVFPAHRRLAIKDLGGVTLYDTGDHFISGVGQQQGSNTGLTFSSQYGSFVVSGLQRVDQPVTEPAHVQPALVIPAAPAVQQVPDARQDGPEFFASSLPAQVDADRHTAEPRDAAAATVDVSSAPVATTSAPSAGGADSGQIIGLIEKLAALRDAGILSEAEFSAKKTELLARL
jgi:Short C-terminal domain